MLTSMNPISNKHSNAPLTGSNLFSTMGFPSRILRYFGSFGLLMTLSANFNKILAASKKSSCGLSSTSCFTVSSAIFVDVATLDNLFFSLLSLSTLYFYLVIVEFNVSIFGDKITYPKIQ